MTRSCFAAELDLELLSGIAAFTIAVDADLSVTWASPSVLKRVAGAVGMSLLRVIECRDTDMEISAGSLAAIAGTPCKLALRSGGSSIPLVGRWLPCRDGFVLLGVPEVKTLEDLNRLSMRVIPCSGRPRWW